MPPAPPLPLLLRAPPPNMSGEEAGRLLLPSPPPRLRLRSGECDEAPRADAPIDAPPLVGATAVG